MPSAARLGDMTSHGTPLGPVGGCMTVLIGGQPAWRALADTHICPYHGGGPVLQGSMTVFIGGMPAARQGDMVIEGVGPNSILMGAPTVQIGS
ncbi:MAG: PAAR domain-containing protein [Anaerolineae bacterium]